MFRCVRVLAKQMFMSGLCMRCAHGLLKLIVSGRCMDVLAVLRVSVFAVLGGHKTCSLCTD